MRAFPHALLVLCVLGLACNRSRSDEPAAAAPGSHALAGGPGDDPCAVYIERAAPGVRCEAIVRRVEQLFPGAGDTTQAQFWTGLRPATPSNVPLIGATRVGNLFLNTGHGTLGWTHACGSGKALADIVSGRVPEVDFAFQGLQGRAGGTALVPSRTAV